MKFCQIGNVQLSGGQCKLLLIQILQPNDWICPLNESNNGFFSLQNILLCLYCHVLWGEMGLNYETCWKCPHIKTDSKRIIKIFF